MHAPISPPIPESTIFFAGLHWALNTVVQSIAATVALVTFIFIAYQSYLSRKSQDFATLHMRYLTIMENNRFIFENPEFVSLSVGPKRYPLIEKMSLKDRREFAALEFMMDNFEFYYLIGKYENPKHAEKFLRVLLKNPEIRQFMKGPLRGTFRRDFERIVEDELSNFDESSLDLESQRDSNNSTMQCRYSSQKWLRAIYTRRIPFVFRFK